MTGPCALCGTTKRRLVVSYWGPTYCPACCIVLALTHTAGDAWPPRPEGRLR